tara:strand:- start:2606 stop:3970 length:1365 start_codon:yes stop_codon:yes gene_type:complete
MPAILSTDFRTLNATKFVERVASADDNLYIGIGKADPWDSTISGTSETVETPLATGGYFSTAYRNLMGMVRVATDKISTMVVRYDWVSGQSDWVAWDNNSATIFDSKFYCVTDEFKVYKLLVVGTGNSTSKPQHGPETVDPVTETDGYIWKYMYSVTASEQISLLTTNYMSVQTGKSTDADSARYDYQQESAGITGSGVAIKGVTVATVTAAGSGYTNGTQTAVAIDGNGTGATVTYVVSGQAVTSATIVSEGAGYDVASITIPGGTGGVITFTIAPENGHGTDPVSELGGRYVLVNAQLDGTGSGDLTVGNDFRQLSLIKNPYEADGTTIATSTTYNPVQALIAATPIDANSLTVTEYITGASSGAIAYVIATNGTTGYISFTQNNKTGYGVFTDGEIVNGNVSGTVTLAATALATDTPEVELNSGEVLLVDNIDPVTRGSNQTEDVKMVIEF